MSIIPNDIDKAINKYAEKSRQWVKQEAIEFGKWLLEESKKEGFYNLGNNKYRYNYISPYTIEDLYNIFKK